MSERSFAIVTTTINVPVLLEDYARDAVESGRDLREIIVVGDRKTSPEAASFCDSVTESTGVRCRFYSVADQHQYLARWPAFREFLPWNCIQRRNVGLLIAYESDVDIVVTIDDDNYLSQRDYLGGHTHLGDRAELPSVASRSGWWNVCEMLEEEHGIAFYHRGHPLSARWQDDGVTRGTLQARAVVNAGLWLDEPDVDAVTRLCRPLKAVARSDAFAEHVACAVGTWAPFNSQNTALLRELMPVYLLFPHVGRYDDVWASYIVRYVADALGDVVTYGAPVVRQDRNAHDYLEDLDAERLGMEYTDALIDALKAAPLNARDYLGACHELAADLPARLEAATAARGKDPRAFDQVAHGLRHWAAIFKDLGKGGTS